MKTTVLEDKLFKMLKDNLADLWQDDLISEAGKSLRNSNPCWKGYHPVGTKKKGGKTVPNCVPSESVAEGSENNNPIANKIFFARSNKAPKGWSYDHVGFITQDGKQIQMSGHKGNDVYVTNAVTDDPEFPKQNIKIVSLSKPVSVPTTNSVRAENCGTFVANVLQANGIKGIDTQKIYSVFKKPQEQGVAEGRPEDLPGIDYDRPGDVKRKQSRGEHNPYPFSKEEDDDYFRDIFRKKREAAAKAKEQGVAEDWNKVNHHDKTNGLSQKAVNAYRRENPGSKLKTAVTTKPSKLKAGSKAAKRRKSFCARMSGNKGPMKKPNGKPTPKALALRRWHCESLEELLVTARQHIYEAEGEPEGLKHLTPHLAKDILDQIETEGVHAIVKSIEWGDGGAKELVDIIKRELKKVANNVSEGWSQKYKSSINCSHPKGFSQKAHCAGKKKHNESHEVMEHVCPDCGMCATHGNLNEIAKGAKDSNGFTKCWPGHHASGTKKGKNGGQVRNCVPNESM